MPRYWVIAPYHADRPEWWERIWEFDLARNLISIGWSKLGDISSLDEQGLRAAIERTYPESAAKRLVFNMLWNFYHSIEPGDIIVARRGTKKIAAVGTVTRKAYYEHDKNAVGQENPYSNHIDVRWEASPRDKQFSSPVFGMQTIYEILEEKFRSLVEGEAPPDGKNLQPEEGVQNQAEFILEKYLEDFIVSNFDAIFGGKFILYRDLEQNLTGQQFATDVGIIDILAQEPATNAFVIVELKKGRESDKVVGQVLRYMGWVAENLCEKGQSVKGIIICKDKDPRLSYALKMTTNVVVKFYRVDFKLSDGNPIQ